MLETAKLQSLEREAHKWVQEAIDKDKPLKRVYYLFECMVSTLQAHIQETKEEQKEETARLLMAQHTTFSKAYKVLQEHMEESVVTE